MAMKHAVRKGIEIRKVRSIDDGYNYERESG